MAKRLTQTAIAEALGISQYTVSQALRGGSDIGPETQRRVLEFSRRHGYRPNVAASNLKAKQTRLVGLLGTQTWQVSVPTVNATVIRFAVERLNERGFSVATDFLAGDRPPFELPGWRVDGYLAIGPRSTEDLAAVEGAGLPYVAVNGVGGKHGSSVIFDDAGGLRLAMDHLTGLGHRRIAYAQLPATGPTPHSSWHTRRQVYERCMGDLGITPLIADVIFRGIDPHDPRARVLSTDGFWRWAAEEARATAVICYSHVLAVNLLGAAGRAGIDVPGRVSLLSIGDEYPCEQMNPALTCTALPSEAAGRLAAELLLKKLENPDARPTHHVLEERLTIRRSTAPPRG